jgi:restriction endonuclease S subunit
LEGLEVSEVMLSYILANNDVFRFDSNYFQKEFLIDEKLIRKRKNDKLSNLSTNIKSFGAYSLNNQVEYIEHGIPFIRGVDMKNGTINFDNIIHISREANELLYKSEVKPEMVLLSMSGTIGDVAIASKNWSYPINSSQDLAKIDTNWLINPYFLYCFLLSKFGQNYLKREARGSVQQHVFLSQIEQLEIPILENSFIEKIETLVKLAHSKLEESKTLYTEAEGSLLFELGFATLDTEVHLKRLNELSGVSTLGVADVLADIDAVLTPPTALENFRYTKDELVALLRKAPKLIQNLLDSPDPKQQELGKKLARSVEKAIEFNEIIIARSQQQMRYLEQNAANIEFILQLREASAQNTNVKSFKDSFLDTGRLDAEYYQRKYEVVETKIREYKGGYKTLGELVSIHKSIETGSEAYSDEGIPYIRVSDLTKYGITTPNICISTNYYQKNKWLLDDLKLTKNTILLSKDGSIGIAHKVSEDLEMITSGALLHLKIKNEDEILPDYLALILNSELVQKQAERDAGGSIIVHWRVSEIENVLIPLIDKETQTLISANIQESFALRTESERLLALAKEAVEVSIEQGEAAAERLLLG